MRVVLDTNTLASGVLAFAGSPAGAILDAWREAAFVLVVSEDIVGELESTLAKPYFADRLATEDTAAFLELLAISATIVGVEGAVTGVATHPEDDRILECAVAGGAAYLVTGDKKLQQLGAYQGVEIVSPRTFLEVLASASG
ncbi:MAG: putative toxin-antitoxin system toxin component, PIN family [Dehalococcoidia bacterium]